MDKYTAIVAMTALISGTIMIAMVAQAIAASIGKRKAKELPETTLVRLEERLSQIEHSIDAMAVEVERISEGQRFTTRLLSERHAETR